MIQRAAIYARVDTSTQVDRRFSLPSQIESCKKFAEQKGFTVVGIYQDEISGTKPIASRPGGRRLFRAINSGQIDAVVVYRVDRLSRDSMDFLKTFRDWLRANIEIYALNMGQVKGELGTCIKTTFK